MWKISPKIKDKLDELEPSVLPQNFIWRDYLELNPDLIELGIDTEKEAKYHFMLFGLSEFRPYVKLYADDDQCGLTLTDLPDDFDWKAYLKYNKDLSFSNIDTEAACKRHYQKWGYSENRIYSEHEYNIRKKTSNGIPIDFDWQIYLRKNPDLHKHKIDTEYKCKQHYLKCGIRENRDYQEKNTIIVKSESIDTNTGLPYGFDARVYQILNPDLSKINTALGLQKHYITHGKKENRRYDCGLTYEQLLNMRSKEYNNNQIMDRYIVFINHESSYTGAPIYCAKLANYYYNNNISKNILFLQPTPGQDYGLHPNIHQDFFFHDEKKLLQLISSYDSIMIYNNSMSPMVTHSELFLHLYPKTIFHFHESLDTIQKYCEDINIENVIKHGSAVYFVAHKILTDVAEEYIDDNIKLAMINYGLSIDSQYHISTKLKIATPAIDVDKILEQSNDKVEQINKDDRVLIGMCGKICDRKNPELFEFIAANNPDYDFVWIGGAIETKLENLISIPETPNPYKYFKQLDYFFLCSKLDPCPTTVLENLLLNNKVILLENNIKYQHPVDELENVCYITDHNNDKTIINKKFQQLLLNKTKNQEDTNIKYIKNNFSEFNIINYKDEPNHSILFSYYDDESLKGRDIEFYTDYINQYIACHNNTRSCNVAICNKNNDIDKLNQLQQLFIDKIQHRNVNILQRMNEGWDIGGLIDLVYNTDLPTSEKIIYLHNKTNVLWRKELFKLLNNKEIYESDAVIPASCYMKCELSDNNRYIIKRHKFMSHIHDTEFYFSSGTAFAASLSSLEPLKEHYQYIKQHLTNKTTDDTFWQKIMRDKHIFEQYYNVCENSLYANSFDHDSRDIMIKNNCKNYFELLHDHNKKGVADCMFEHAIERLIGYLITYRKKVKLI